MPALLLGPFTREVTASDIRPHPHRRSRIVFHSASKLHPRDSVALDPRRILAVYEAGGRLYVAYNTSKTDFYAPFTTKLPPDAKPIKHLTYKKLVCIDDDHCFPCNVDPWADPACFEEFLETREVVAWRARGSVDERSLVQRDPLDAVLSVPGGVTPRNVEEVVKSLADWDGLSDELKYETLDAVRLVQPLLALVLARNLHAPATSAPYAVVVAYTGSSGATMYAYKVFQDKVGAERLYRKLADRLSALAERAGRAVGEYAPG